MRVITTSIVLALVLGSTPVCSCGLNGRYHCSRCNAYNVRKPTMLNSSIATA